MFEIRRRRSSGRESLHYVGLNHRHLCSSVIEIIFVIGRRKDRVHHRDDRADLGDAEPCGYELDRVGQDYQHAVFHLDPEVTQHVADSVSHLLDFAIAILLRAAINRDLVAEPFLDARIEEVGRHIELFRKSDRHCFEKRPSASSASSASSAVDPNSGCSKQRRTLRTPMLATSTSSQSALKVTRRASCSRILSSCWSVSPMSSSPWSRHSRRNGSTSKLYLSPESSVTHCR